MQLRSVRSVYVHGVSGYPLQTRVSRLWCEAVNGSPPRTDGANDDNHAGQAHAIFGTPASLLTSRDSFPLYSFLIYYWLSQIVVPTHRETWESKMSKGNARRSTGRKGGRSEKACAAVSRISPVAAQPPYIPRYH